MAVYANLPIDQGSTYTSTVSVEGGNSLPFNLTGYSARGHIRKNYSSSSFTAFSTTINNAIQGEINLSLTSTQTAALKAGRYVYDVEIIESSTGNITRVVEGQVEIFPRATVV